MAIERTYFVWRHDATCPFRTYRVTRKRPSPVATDAHRCLWIGSSYRSGLRVQKAANYTRGEHRPDKDQQLLFPEFFREFASDA